MVFTQELSQHQSGVVTVWLADPNMGQMDLLRPDSAPMDHFGPFWSRECQDDV